MSKVAIASTDGISINEHFGRAEEFLIYEVNEGGTYQFLEHRKNNPHCSTEKAHHTADATAELLADVKVVLVSQIGPGAAKALEAKGVVPLTVTGTIEKALQAYGKRGKLLESNILSGCRPSGGSCGCSGGCK